SYGSFSRSLRLPYKPDEKKITAAFKDGILSLAILRPSAEKPSVHKIPIEKK
ncbi:MAG TPA: Hsp20 family protein, partial [Alphaproteobacteria bacterium]|nr:Hsp20 family protein [Alphaproteobacteria bacterium]